MVDSDTALSCISEVLTVMPEGEIFCDNLLSAMPSLLFIIVFSFSAIQNFNLRKNLSANFDFGEGIKLSLDTPLKKSNYIVNQARASFYYGFFGSAVALSIANGAIISFRMNDYVIGFTLTALLMSACVVAILLIYGRSMTSDLVTDHPLAEVQLIAIAMVILISLQTGFFITYNIDSISIFVELVDKEVHFKPNVIFYLPLIFNMIVILLFARGERRVRYQIIKNFGGSAFSKKGWEFWK